MSAIAPWDGYVQRALFVLYLVWSFFTECWERGRPYMAVCILASETRRGILKRFYLV
ncbi:hypothetical protein BDV25DRAFT_153853 [Aspergillus avenaceus]|uniref:Uncharacterized protein n=1 Tax=Aspergillus avenaceus TaxID=36643 RepID=A0A5N6TWD7_ASPAV|nr:hypothetical protein BDV25DRAFT_153853 [Aspergillus avenaceus]